MVRSPLRLDLQHLLLVLVDAEWLRQGDRVAEGAAAGEGIGLVDHLLRRLVQGATEGQRPDQLGRGLGSRRGAGGGRNLGRRTPRRLPRGSVTRRRSPAVPRAASRTGSVQRRSRRRSWRAPRRSRRGSRDQWGAGSDGGLEPAPPGRIGTPQDRQICAQEGFARPQLKHSTLSPVIGTQPSMRALCRKPRARHGPCIHQASNRLLTGGPAWARFCLA